jgi:hypothetical protein
MILCAPNFPPLGVDGKPPRPLVLLLGQGGWQLKAAGELSSSCACVLRTDVLKTLPPAVWIEVLINYASTVDAIGIWAGDEGLYLDEWTMGAYVCAKRPQVVVCGSAPDPSHPMTPGFINLAMQAGASAFAKYEIFIAALRDKARQTRRLSRG